MVILKGTVTDYDAAAEVVDLFDTASDNNGTLSGAVGVNEKAVVIVAANDGTTATVAYVADAGTAGIVDGEVTIVGSFTGATADTVDLLAAANFVLD